MKHLSMKGDFSLAQVLKAWCSEKDDLNSGHSYEDRPTAQCYECLLQMFHLVQKDFHPSKNAKDFKLILKLGMESWWLNSETYLMSGLNSYLYNHPEPYGRRLGKKCNTCENK